MKSVECYSRSGALLHRKRFRQAKALVKEQALVQIGGKSTEALGAKIIAKRLPSKWDYHNDEKIVRLETEIKAHKAMIQTLTKPMVDPDTGEVAMPAEKIEGGETISIQF